MQRCSICPKKCNVPRPDHAAPGTAPGFCKMGRAPVLARAALHHWEEPCISGTNGSGTVFFSGCTLKCIYCQNYEISSDSFGQEITVTRLQEIYGELIAQGAHNINLVSPTHFLPAILESLSKSLPVPVVYNSSGYESVPAIRSLAGKVQVYLPDFKYADEALGLAYSGIPDYPEVAKKAIEEMYAQVGPCVFGEDGLLKSGLIIRHLVLPGQVENSLDVIDWVTSHFQSGQVLFSLMSQYTPCRPNPQSPELGRPVTPAEYAAVEDHLFATDFESGFVQELDSSGKVYIPSFALEGVTHR